MKAVGEQIPAEMQGMWQGAVPEPEPEGRGNPVAVGVHLLGSGREQLQDTWVVGQMHPVAAAACQDVVVALAGALPSVEVAVAAVVDGVLHWSEEPVESG